jgi:Peptidase family M1 domain
MMRPNVAALVLGALLVASCAPSGPGNGATPLILVTNDPNATVTPTPFQPSSASGDIAPTPTEVPTQTPLPADTATPPEPTATNVPTLAPPPSATRAAVASPAPNVTPGPPSGNTRTRYTLYLTLDYAGHSADVSEDVRYVNATGQSLSDIVMAVEPNLWKDCFALKLLDEDGSPVSKYTLDGQRLTIALARPLPEGATTTLSVGYRLSLPLKSGESPFGYRSDQLNLTDWYPFIVPFDGEWVLHDAWPFGEHLVYDSADFDVYVMVKDSGITLAASAPAVVNGTSTAYHLEGARTFALSASDSYRVEESAVGPVKIEAYALPGHQDANKAVLWMATQSLGLYAAKFAPYPYSSLSIVESDLPDGQEYDGLVFLGSKFYDDYGGTARSNLFTIGTHEIAHQWWFGLVGSDQEREPWLDEALAVYSERIFYEYNYPNYGDWWWDFRVNYFSPAGKVDAELNSFATFQDYVSAVYLNGANMLEELRGRVGDDAFFQFLQDYASTYARGHATGEDFFALLRKHTNKDLSDIMQTYLQGQY